MANSLENAMLIPYHYGTYDMPDAVAHNGDPREVLSNVRNAQQRVRHLAPGQPFRMRERQEI